MGAFDDLAGSAAGAAASSFAGPVAGSIASSLVGGLFGKKKKKKKSGIRPFTPANLYTPSGNATWAGGNGTATLSPELQKYQNYYGENANNYQNKINSYFAPNRNNFFTSQPTAGTNGFTPMNFNEWSSQNSRSKQYNYPINTGNSLSDRNQITNSQPTQQEYQQYLNATPARAATNGSVGTFDQAGFDAANTNYVSPEQTMYDKLRTLSQPAEDQARAEMESRLFSQGLMGASNGQGYNPTIKAFNDSTHQADLQRELTALTSKPDLIAKWQNLQNSQSSGAQGLSQIPNELLKFGFVLLLH